MNGIIGRTSSHWVRYCDYEWKHNTDGVLYLTPVKNAKPSIYDPMKEYEQIVVDAMNIGRLCMGKKPDEEIQMAIREFALKYGLFGLMTALPTTPTFMDYEAVYLPKNHFIKAETMNTLEYVSLFFPFGGIDLKKRGAEVVLLACTELPVAFEVMDLFDDSCVDPTEVLAAAAIRAAGAPVKE